MFILLLLSTALIFSQNAPSSPQKKNSVTARTRKTKHGVKHPRGADETAQQALATLRSLINPGNFKQFGLQSVDEAQRLTLETPLPLFYVRSDQLKDYKPGTDAGKLMINARRLLYPVALNGTGRIVITIEDRDGEWRLVSFGQQEIAPALTQIKNHKVDQLKTGPGAFEQNYFAVQVPSMHLSFLAYAPSPGPGGNEDLKRQVTLTPLTTSVDMAKSVGFSNSNFLVNNPKFSAEKEGAKSANEVFKVLAPNAGKVANAMTPD